MTDDPPKLSPKFENIPKPLRGRPQWLMWDARADRPKQPHWNGDHYGISWSDPDDWGSWSEARELVAGTDSWGIGYVNAVENDDYPSGRVFSLDIDGGVVDAEAAELAEWVPPLDPFLERDAYVEISPSGEGLKIPVLASSAPEWWTDMDNDDEHVGCEVLDNKFTTLTGNLWPGAGTELPVYGDWLDEWLEAASRGLEEAREVYEAQTRPTPQSSLDETARGDADGAADYEGDGYDADVETVRDALACVSPDLGYNEWRNVGFAVADALDAGGGVEARTTAREVYVAWSRGDYHPDLADDATASAWDAEARSRAEKVIDGWEPPSDGDVTAGTLWSLALDADHGPREWSPPSDWKGDDGEPPAWKKKLVADGVYPDIGAVPDDPVTAIPRVGDDGETADQRVGGADDGSDGGDGDEFEDAAEWEEELVRDGQYPSVEDVPDDATVAAHAAYNDGEQTDAEDAWNLVRTQYVAVNDRESSVTKGDARQEAERVLNTLDTWLYVYESERLLWYDENTGTFKRHGEKRLQETLKRYLGSHYSTTELREIRSRVEAGNGCRRSELDAAGGGDGELLCVGNGVIDLEAGELHDHSPEYRMTRGLEWDYDPERADKEPILEFLDDVTERVADRDTLLDHLAAGLLPSHTTAAFVVAYGPGENGKTRVSKLFSGFVGDDNSAAVEINDLTNSDYGASDLDGKFLSWGDDMSGDQGGTLTDLSMLKKATGDSPIRANEKYVKTYKFTNQASLFFSANEPPRFGEKTDAIARRLYPIRMPYQFVNDPDDDDPQQKEKEPRIAEKLLNNDAAMRGLLSLAVDHAQQVLSTDEYSQPETPQERLQKYRGESDPIVRFARTALEPGDGDDLVRKDDAYTVYQAFADAWGERVAGEDGFKRQLSRAAPFDLDTSQSRALAGDGDGDRVRCWKYVAWSDDATEVMPEWVAERYDGVRASDGDATDSQPVADTLSPAGVTEEVVDDSGRVPAVEGRVTTAWTEEAYGSETPKLTLSNGAGSRTASVVGRERPELREDVHVVVTGARADRGEFGGVELVIDPQTDVTVISTPGGDGNDQAATATDGGADTETDSGGVVMESETSAESTDDDARDEDPERPHGPHDDAQCRECGLYWQAGSPDDAPRRECPDCGKAVDWEWNVDTGRVPASAAPDDPDTDHETVRGRVVEWLRDDPDPVTVTAATVDLGVDADDARDALDALVEDGRLIDTDTEGRYEVNR